MIPEGFISSLLERADIVDVVGRYVTLKKGGRNMMACCPFHKEKTPSFSVSPSKQIYKCFGCGKAGNAIGFLMEIEHLDFPEAVRKLAEIYGMTVPEDASPEKARERARAKTLGDFMKEAADYYSAMLKSTQRASDYLKQREITGETAARFGLGFSPDGWHGLQAVFPGDKYQAKELLEVGLVLEKNGSRYDAFRGRIMFPIRTPKGTVIGFGARTMKGDEQPKYLNSPETPIYHKGSELYGLYEGRSAVVEKGRAIVCEGYMDVIQLSQAGFREAVAALGTSITPEHVKKLFKLADQVYFSFDGDAAGRKAARRALEAALPVIKDGQIARFVLLPPEHDPDSLIKAEGPQAYERELEKSLPLTDFLVSSLTSGKSLSFAEERVQVLAEAKPLVLSMKNAPVLKLAIMRELARLSKLELEDLEKEWGTGAPERPAPVFKSFSDGRRFPRGNFGSSYGFGSRRPMIEPRARVKGSCERMLQCFLAYPELFEEFTPQIEDEFVSVKTEASERILEVWRAASEEDGFIKNPAALLMRLEHSPNRDRYTALLAEELVIETPEEAARIELRRAFLDLERERIKLRLTELSQQPADEETIEQLKKLSARRLDIDKLVDQAAQEDREWRRKVEESARQEAFAQAEEGRADVAYADNPKVRALQEHLFGAARLSRKDAAPPKASPKQPTASAPAAFVPAARVNASAERARAAWGSVPGSPFAPQSPSSNPFGKPPSNAGFAAAAPDRSADSSAPAASAKPVSAARKRRDEIFAVMAEQAEKPVTEGAAAASSGDALTPPAGFVELPDDAHLSGWAEGIDEFEQPEFEPDMPADIPPAGFGAKK